MSFCLKDLSFDVDKEISGEWVVGNDWVVRSFVSAGIL